MNSTASHHQLRVSFLLFAGLCLQECALPAEPPPLGGGLGYLIVAPRSLVDAGVLDEFVAYKRELDFNVFVAETEEIAAKIGEDFPEKLREYLKLVYQPNSFGPANVRYVLLIGGHDTIPHRRIYPYWPDRPETVTSTDWYYADLVGDWDSNGDGMFGQGVLLREPTDQAYLENYSIAVGRLPFINDATVELALDTIIRSETDPGAWKDRALLVGAFMEFEGRAWTPRGEENGHYESRGDKIGADTDNAVLMERVWEDILLPAGMRRTRVYETRPKPTPLAEPHSGYEADYALGEQGLIDAWNSEGHGLVNVAAHGGSKTVAQYWWEWERIENSILEYPTEPCCDELERGHDSYNEMKSAQFLNTGTLADLEPPDGGAPVVIVAGCGVAAGVDDLNNLGATFLSTGKASAFIGAIGSVGYQSAWDGLTDLGVMQDVLHQINLYLIEHCYRVGDAMWNAVAQRYRHAVNANVSSKSKALIKQLLYGDPAMSYWGDASDSVGPWPMFRHDLRNSGRTPYPGPQVPEVKWTFPIASVSLGDAIPSPIVGRDGTIYVGSQSGRLYAVNPDGTEKWHHDVGVPINCAPTLTGNGTLYFRAEDGHLHAVTDSGQPLWHEPVELNDGFAGPTPLWPPFSNSPRVGTDGTIYTLAVDAHFNPPLLVLGGFWRNGELWNGAEFDVSGGAGTPALAPDGTLYAGTWDGRLFHFDRFTGDLSDAELEGSVLGSPAVSDSRVYVGTAAGKMYALTPELEEIWHFDVPDGTLSRAINSSPAIGPEGNVYFGSWSDRLYAVNRDGSLRWSYNTGGDVDSSPALDETTVYVVGGKDGDAKVFALQRFTGEERWVVPIGGNSRWGSSPAIGYDETIYVVSSAGQLIAIGPANGLGAPSDLSIEDSAPDEITIDWRDNSRKEIGFNLERRVGWSGDFIPIATLAANAMRYTDKGLKPSTTYFYRVRALGSASFSGYSNEAHARTPRRRPKTPGGLTAGADSSTSIHLKWTGPDRNAAGIAVYRSATAAGPFARIGTVVGDANTFLDSNSLVTSGLSDLGDPRPGQKYFYNVRAFNSQGESSPSMTVSAMTRSLTLPAPGNITAEVFSSSRVRIRWQDRTTAETGYVVERTSDELAGYETVATLPAGATSFEDATVESGWFTYRVRAVSPNNDSPFAVSEQVFVGEVQPLRIDAATVRWTGSQFEFSWSAEAGRRYQVQYKNRLTDPTWSNVGTPITASDSTASVVDLVSGQKNRFYRVVRLD